MATLDSLPGDQRAVLELVLGRGRSYDEIAGLLSIDRGAVHDRALAALDALGPPTDVATDDRRTICDYLLGQLPAARAEAVRERLAGSPAQRAWAGVVSGELAPLADHPLPEIPAGGPAPLAASEPLAPEPPPGPPSSRRGGMIVLALGAAALIAVVVVVVIVTSSGGGSQHDPVAAAGSSTTTAANAASAASTSSTSSTTSATTSAKVVAQINLDPTAAGSRAAGVAEVLQEGTTKGIAVVAQNMAPNTKKPANAYGVWLYSSPSHAKFLGFVNPGVGKDGKLQAASQLPSGAGGYKQLIVTVETAAKPTRPGQIVLRGTLTGV